MSNRAGYQPLSQSIDEEADVGDISNQPGASADFGTRAGKANGRRRARPGSIDLGKLDHAFKRWTESIAQKVKRKKKAPDAHSRKQILRSVFEPAIQPTSISLGPVKTLDHNPPMTQAEFDILIQSVKSAIMQGIHPKMITKGSSGSYFARAKVETGKVQTVAVFKPKDEEPYGRLNPKTTKWLHRQLRWIIPFGRACLIPNLSYISEAAASLLDERLHLHIVPRTQLVSLSSQAFFYDWIDRKKRPLPEKIGSMQYFLHGYQDASEFLRKHPWPGRAISDTFDDSNHRQKNLSRRFLNAFRIICGRTGDADELFDDADYEDERHLFDATETDDMQRPFYWSQTLQQNFREELEKLVILDYLMLNTDRGADNYMIKYCEGEHEKPLVDVAPSRTTRLEMPLMSELRRTDVTPMPSSTATLDHLRSMAASPSPSDSPQSDYTRRPHIHIAAIDNSLSFPHEHPQGWRSYTYGWLYLPVSVIGRPFSEKTRNHFLPLLTSKAWWEETTYQLEKLFAVDPDFHPKMFKRQLAVIKGQAWNIVQSLKHSDEGPLELTRRKKVLVWDDEIELAEEAIQESTAEPSGPVPSSSRASISSVPLPRRARSHSYGSEFPPPMRRQSTDSSGTPRPVPFAHKLQKIHPGTTGVTVLEHLEKLDAVEAGLQRLGVANEEDDMEVDVGEAGRSKPGTSNPASRVPGSAPPHITTSPTSPQPAIRLPQPPNSAPPFSPSSGTSTSNLPSIATSNAPSSSNTNGITSPFSPPGSPLTTVQEADFENDGEDRSSIGEEDLVMMSKSTSHVEGSSGGGWGNLTNGNGRGGPSHGRWGSQSRTNEVGRQGGSGSGMLGVEQWIQNADSTTKRPVIIERLETVDVQPLCGCW